MPMAGLHEVVSSPPAYKRLLQLCRGGNSPTGPDGENTGAAIADTPPTFVVVPALEFVGATSPDDSRIHALLEETDNTKHKAADLIASGEVQAFHAGCFPEGHRQTNLDRWTALDADAAPYEVKYAEGYEPYGLFFRRHAPGFDERFRGFGLDKVRRNQFSMNVVREQFTHQKYGPVKNQARKSTDMMLHLLVLREARQAAPKRNPCLTRTNITGLTLLASPSPRLAVQGSTRGFCRRLAPPLNQVQKNSPDQPGLPGLGGRFVSALHDRGRSPRCGRQCTALLFCFHPRRKVLGGQSSELPRPAARLRSAGGAVALGMG